MNKDFIERFEELEKIYPGITKQIWRFEHAVLPPCSFCGSDDTVDVQIGLIGRTINISAATRKLKLLPKGPAPGDYFCNECKKYFTTED